MALFNGNNGNAEAAIDAVNAEQNTADACVIATAAYRRGDGVGTVRSDETTLTWCGSWWSASTR